MYFFKFSIFNIRKHFNGKRAGLMFCSLLISQAQATVRAPVSASVVRLTGLCLGFSKPLRVGSGALGTHGGDPCIWVSMGKPWMLVSRSSVGHGEGPTVSRTQELSEVLKQCLWNENIKVLRKKPEKIVNSWNMGGKSIFFLILECGNGASKVKWSEHHQIKFFCQL